MADRRHYTYTFSGAMLRAETVFRIHCNGLQAAEVRGEEAIEFGEAAGVGDLIILQDDHHTYPGYTVLVTEIRWFLEGEGVGMLSVLCAPCRAVIGGQPIRMSAMEWVQHQRALRAGDG